MHFRKSRVSLGIGIDTTVYLSVFSRSSWSPQIEMTGGDMFAWSRGAGVSEALSGGFFVHRSIMGKGEEVGDPLGEVWLDGQRKTQFPFADPWAARRGAISIKGDTIRIDSFENLSKNNPQGLLQAGPLLAQNASLIDFSEEGFSEDKLRFNSDITIKRHPRAAIALSENNIFLFACDGRQPGESGMLLQEVGAFLLQAGAEDVLNLDGGESVSFFHAGKMQNTPVGEESRLANDPNRITTPTAISLRLK